MINFLMRPINYYFSSVSGRGQVSFFCLCLLFVSSFLRFVVCVICSRSFVDLLTSFLFEDQKKTNIYITRSFICGALVFLQFLLSSVV